MKNCKKIPVNLVKPVGYQKFLRRCGLNAIIAPVRMNGLTSSGISGACYYNVANLVELYGGDVLLGWAVTAESLETIDNQNKKTITNSIYLMSHALWLNDEGKASDPTAKSWLKPEDIKSHESDFFGFIWNNNIPHIQFIPLATTNEDIEYCPYSVRIEQVTRDTGEVIKDWSLFVLDEGNNKYKLNWNKLHPKNNQRNFLEYMGCPSDAHEKLSGDKYRRKLGGFMERSLVTGRSIEEIQASRFV